MKHLVACLDVWAPAVLDAVCRVAPGVGILHVDSIALCEITGA